MQQTVRGVRVCLVAALALLGAALTSLATSAGSATAAITQAPTAVSPPSGERLTTFGPTLRWALPAGSTQYHLQVVPFGNDGPGINLIGNATDAFAIPAPPDWYGLLPDMTYTWRVRATDATVAVDENHPSWGPWSPEATFRTPQVGSSIVSPFAPEPGATVANLTPVLTWASSTADVFYWEVQVSKDPAFGPDAFLYWELRHGGVTVPTNSYAIPSAFPLEPGTTYYWRVRPRVQGDGAAVPWPPASSFKTPARGGLTLQVDTPPENAVVNTRTVTVSGVTKPGALVTVDTAFQTAGADGRFSLTVSLMEGLNELQVMAFDLATGDRVTVVRTVTYFP